MKNKKVYGGEIENINDDFLIENDSQHDFDMGKCYNNEKGLDFDFANPYLMDPDLEDREQTNLSVSYLTDKSIFERYNCDYITDEQSINNWHEFFAYLNERIKRNMFNGYYFLKLNNIPKHWVETSNIIIMVIRILYFKHYKCKLTKTIENNNYYTLLIRWDLLPDEIFEDNNYEKNIIFQTPAPGSRSWTETSISDQDKMNELESKESKSLLEKLFGRSSLKN